MLAIVLTLLVCATMGNPIDGVKQQRIIGGNLALPGQFSYQTSLRFANNGIHFCSGSIISREWILTSAHCVADKLPSKIKIVVGTNYLDRGGWTHSVSVIHSHGNFNPKNNINDIAVLHLMTHIVSAPGVASIPLTFSITPSNKPAVLSGWGYTSYPSGKLSNELRFINLMTISVLQCQTFLPLHAVFNSHVCTYMETGKGACEGDFGSPLVLNGMQHGIASWVIPCAKGSPDVFTSVFFYRTWIKSVTDI